MEPGPDRPVRTATLEDLPAVMNVLDGAALAVSAPTVRRRIETGHVLISVSESGTVLAAMVVIPRQTGVHVEAIAVRPGRRNQGIGSRLVAEAADRWERLTAAFDSGVSDFYEVLGFDVRPTGERCFGELVRARARD